MDKEIFQIVFNSQASNVLSPVATALNIASITYNVNWRALIPLYYFYILYIKVYIIYYFYILYYNICYILYILYYIILYYHR